MDSGVVVLRIIIVIYNLLIFPAKFYFVRIRTEVIEADVVVNPVHNLQDITMNALFATNSALWLVYGAMIDDWVLCFTSVFNLCILVAIAYIGMNISKKGTSPARFGTPEVQSTRSAVHYVRVLV
tara:strand:- start:1297 stop:1671 length:375 start_codon:yes stop_codon:yes gene_type:complete